MIATQETAQFSVEVQVQLEGQSPICPFDCGGHGTCSSPGQCSCDSSWQGVACQVRE